MVQISIKDYLTASGKYPERENHPEVTPELIANATILLDKVESLLNDLGIEHVIVSSGFRPSEVNAQTKGSAKHSTHMTGEGIDIADPKNELDNLLLTRQDLLIKYDLYQESPDSSPRWSHLQSRKTASGKRVFIP